MEAAEGAVPDLKGLSNKGTADVDQEPGTETREAMLIPRAP